MGVKPQRPRGQRCRHRGHRERAGDVVVELPLDAADHPFLISRPVAGSEAPAVFAIVREFKRVANGILLLHERRLSAVLKVVAAVFPHERIAQVAEVDPQVRKLMRE